MNDYESKKAARQDQIRVRAEDARNRGELPNMRQIEKTVNRRADLLDKQRGERR